jgi:hypothetical protein
MALPNYDGLWSVLIVTEKGDCDRGYRYPIRITHGILNNAGDAAARRKKTRDESPRQSASPERRSFQPRELQRRLARRRPQLRRHSRRRSHRRRGSKRRSAALHILAEFLGRASKWRGNPKPNFTVGYFGLRPNPRSVSRIEFA